MQLFHKKSRQQILTSDPQQFTLLRVMSLSTMILLAMISLGTLWFFYTAIYKRGVDVSAIKQARNEGTVRLIDFDHLAQIETAWTEKHSTSTLQIPPDPFYVPSANPSSPASLPKPGNARQPGL